MFDLFGSKKVAVFMKELECSSVDEGLFYQIQAMTTN